MITIQIAFQGRGANWLPEIFLTNQEELMSGGLFERFGWVFQFCTIEDVLTDAGVTVDTPRFSLTLCRWADPMKARI